MNLITLLAISLLPLLYFLVPGLPITHDGPDHVARIANFYRSLTEGNIIPRWAGNLNWGYGHPILMFLYPMSSYIASVFHFTGFSFVDATKLVFIAAFIGSMVAMYLWTKLIQDERTAFIASLLYGFAPYRFVDMTVRGAIGEHMAFVFPPLACYFLVKLAKSGDSRRLSVRNGIYVALSVGALILAHNAISIMFVPVIILYAVYLFVSTAKRNRIFLVVSLLSIIAGFGVSAFFWIPAVFEGKYTLRDIVTAGGVSDRFVPPLNFFYSSWSYGNGNELSKSLGLVGWIGIAASVWLLFREIRKELKWFTGGLLIILFGSLFIMTSASSFLWERITLLQKFQFPWRFLSVSVFATAVLGGIGISGFILNFKKHTGILTVLFTVAIIASTVYMWKPKGYMVKPEYYFSGIYNSTTDTGESSPIWSVRFMEHRPDRPMDVISGSADIQPILRTSTRHLYQVSVHSDARLAENTLYFPGWNVYINNVQTAIEFQDPNYRGLMTFYIPKGEYRVDVIFTDTKVRKIADFASILTLILLSGGFIISLWLREK